MDEDKQVTEVRESNETENGVNVKRQSVRTEQSVPTSVMAQRVVWYVTGFIIVLLALRLVLQLLGANQGNAFVDFIYGLSGVFAVPFFGMFSYEPSYGVSYFEVSTLVAIIVYALAGWGVAKLFTLGSNRAEV